MASITAQPLAHKQTMTAQQHDHMNMVDKCEQGPPSPPRNVMHVAGSTELTGSYWLHTHNTGILTVAVVTYPFSFEGRRRSNQV